MIYLDQAATSFPKIKEVQVTMEDRIAGQSIYSGLFSSFKYIPK